MTGSVSGTQQVSGYLGVMVMQDEMDTVKQVYIISNVSDDLKWTTNTHVTPFTLTSEA